MYVFFKPSVKLFPENNKVPFASVIRNSLKTIVGKAFILTNTLFIRCISGHSHGFRPVDLLQVLRTFIKSYMAGL